LKVELRKSNTMFGVGVDDKKKKKKNPFQVCLCKKEERGYVMLCYFRLGNGV
jgi:hypothetical protein